MKKAVGVAGLLAAGLFFSAQTTSKVDQGKPGNQGPWPVTLNGSSVTIVISTDGGFFGTTATQPCKNWKQSNTTVGASAVIVPATPLANRIWVQVCNDILNTSSAQCKCAGNTCPTFAAASVGDTLATGDCATYPINAADAGVPCCICNGAGVALDSAECSLQ